MKFIREYKDIDFNDFDEEEVPQDETIRVGDKVMVNDNLKKYGWSHMHEFIGKEYIIKEIGRSNYYLRDLRNFYFPKDTIDKVS